MRNGEKVDEQHHFTEGGQYPGLCGEPECSVGRGHKIHMAPSQNHLTALAVGQRRSLQLVDDLKTLGNALTEAQRSGMVRQLSKLSMLYESELARKTRMKDTW